CDEVEQYSHLAPEAYANLKRTNPEAEAYMATYSSADEKECEPLQAADAVVYEMRRYLQLSLGQRMGSVRQQFKLLYDAEAVGMIADVRKENLLNIVSKTKAGEPFTFDVLMDLGFLENDIPLKL